MLYIYYLNFIPEKLVWSLFWLYMIWRTRFYNGIFPMLLKFNFQGSPGSLYYFPHFHEILWNIYPNKRGQINDQRGKLINDTFYYKKKLLQKNNSFINEINVIKGENQWSEDYEDKKDRYTSTNKIKLILIYYFFTSFI